jgi:heat shock protein HslJ
MTAPPGALLDEVADGEYRSVAITESGRPHNLIPGTTVELRFRLPFLTASAGCNRMAGTYEIVDGRLNLAEEAGMTILACPPNGSLEQQGAHWDQDMWLQVFLKSRPYVIQDGQGLTLDNGTTRIEFLTSIVNCTHPGCRS